MLRSHVRDPKPAYAQTVIRPRAATLRRAADLRLTGTVLLGLVVAVVALRVVPALDWVADEFQRTRGLTRLERELAPARAVDIDPRPIEAAAALIPPDATFAILVGSDYEFTFPGTARALPSWASYRLLPRRPVADPLTAEWVISYGEPLGPHGLRPDESFDLGLGVTLARVR